MTWPFAQREVTATTLLAERTAGRSSSVRRAVKRDEALRNSATWACLRLRADLISTLPQDVFRRVNGVQFEQAKPPVLITPGGKTVRMMEWMYSTQVDLDSAGNTVGIITAIDGIGNPAVIELQNIDDVTYIGKGSKIVKFKIKGVEYFPEQIWHEKQYTLSGVPIGLSPIAYAAATLNTSISAQQFAADWFGNSTMPGGHLKNLSKVLKRGEAARAKSAFKASVASGDVWVSGMDWEYNTLSAKASESQFLETQKAGIPDICRWLGVPGDMIDAESSSGSITYANVSQRNLQLLIMNIGPAIARREEAMSFGLLPPDRYLKLNTAALLRMDLKTRYDSYKVGIDSGFLDEDEARELENMPPLEQTNSKKVLKAADALGALVRAGFEPEPAAAALGLEPIKHTGLVPITVAPAETK